MKYDFTTLSRRGEESIKWYLMNEASPETKFDEDALPQSIADMDFLPAPEIANGLSQVALNTNFGYLRTTDAYYEAVQNWMQRRHNFVPKKEWFILSDGVVPALHKCVLAFTKENEGVCILTPVYPPFYSAIRDNNRKIYSCPLQVEGTNVSIDFDALENTLKDDNVKMMIFCSPHNPVGRVWTKEEVESVAKLCLENGVLLVSDEIHFDIIMSGFEHTSLLNLDEKYYNNAIICTAPTKTFSIAGLKVSNIFVPNKDLREQLSKFLHVELSTFAYKSCEIAYNQAEAWFDECLQVIENNAKIIADFMAKNYPNIPVYPLQGTYLLWMDFTSLGLTKEALEDLWHKHHLFFDEGYIFGEEGNLFERINIACPERNIRIMLKRMDKALKSLK